MKKFAILAFVVLATAQAHAIQSEQSPLRIGSMAPDFTVMSLDGKKVRLSSLRGHPVLLDFWATWCPPCREGLPITNEMHTRFQSQGLKVFAISDEVKKTVADFVKQNKYTMPTYLDKGNLAAAKYKVSAIPSVVVINAKGRIVSYSVGLEPKQVVLSNLKKAGIKVK